MIGLFLPNFCRDTTQNNREGYRRTCKLIGDSDTLKIIKKLGKQLLGIARYKNRKICLVAISNADLRVIIPISIEDSKTARHLKKMPLRAFYNREIAKRVVADLVDRGYDAELLVPEENDISLEERVRRVNAACFLLGNWPVFTLVRLEMAQNG